MNWTLLSMIIFGLFITFSLNTMRRAIQTIAEAQGKHAASWDKKLANIRSLLSMVSATLPPGIRRYFMYVLENPDITSEEAEKMRTTMMAEDFTSIRNHILQCMDSIPDPELKEGLSKTISDMDDVWNLLNSIDENSSEEQKQLVQSELMRIIAKGRGGFNFPPMGLG